jgi:membrane complex biogenesis BtpA family protein
MIGPLIGMVHLGPLPGSPGYAGDLDDVVRAAITDAITLSGAGFDAILIENFGDAPFFADDVPDATVAAITRAATEVSTAVDLPMGINVLRNDAFAAVSIAAAVSAAFIRVNVLTGEMATDQGPIVGKAAEVARLRAALGIDIEVAAARDTWERGGANALIVSGASTGDPADPADLRDLRAAVPDAPILIGSGATIDTVAALLQIADGVIVGTSLKVEGATTAPVDAARAAAFAAAARH